MQIEYKGKKLHIATSYCDNGQGLLVFLHGLGCTKESFIKAWGIEELQNYSILSVDFLGHGESSRPSDFSYTMEDHAETVNFLLQQMRQPRIHLVAHSMGGAIGLLTAEALGSRLKTFVNVEGNLIAEDCNTSRKIISVSYREFKNQKFQELKETFKNYLENSYQLWGKWLEKSDALACYKSAESLVAWSDSGKLLTKFKEQKNKKVYIYGERSYLQKKKLLGLLEGIPSIAIANSEHFVMNDNPHDFYQMLSKILE